MNWPHCVHQLVQSDGWNIITEVNYHDYDYDILLLLLLFSSSMVFFTWYYVSRSAMHTILLSSLFVCTVGEIICPALVVSEIIVLKVFVVSILIAAGMVFVPRSFKWGGNVVPTAVRFLPFLSVLNVLPPFTFSRPIWLPSRLHYMSDFCADWRWTVKLELI